MQGDSIDFHVSSTRPSISYGPKGRMCINSADLTQWQFKNIFGSDVDPKKYDVAAVMYSLSGNNHDVKMGARASQITSPTIVYLIVYSDADQRKHQAPRHWPLCGEITGDRWIPRTNGQLLEKCFNFMTSSCSNGNCPSWGSWLMNINSRST